MKWNTIESPATTPSQKTPVTHFQETNQPEKNQTVLPPTPLPVAFRPRVPPLHPPTTQWNGAPIPNSGGIGSHDLCLCAEVRSNAFESGRRAAPPRNRSFGGATGEKGGWEGWSRRCGWNSGVFFGGKDLTWDRGLRVFMGRLRIDFRKIKVH